MDYLETESLYEITEVISEMISESIPETFTEAIMDFTKINERYILCFPIIVVVSLFHYLLNTTYA